MSPTELAVLVPLAAALVVSAVPRSEPGLVRGLGLLGCLIELVVIATLLLGWDPEGAAVQQSTLRPWLPSFGVAWSLGLEGSVLAPLSLIGLVFPLALMIGQRPRPGEPPLVVGMLVLQSAWVAVLLARDLVVLATCWEIATVTMVVLLGERGDGKQGVPGRTAAARRFAAHVLPGAAAWIAAVALLGVAHSHASAGTWSWDIDAVAQVVMPAKLQTLGFVLVMITLATSLPLVPLQGWLGPIGASGPTPTLAVLMGVGMPMAVVLLQRVALPLFPLAAGEWADPLAALAIVGATYAALACWAEREPGRLLGHAALLHGSMAVLAVLAGTGASWLALGPIVLAQGLGLTLLALVFGWLRRRQVGNLGELAGWAAVAPRALAMAIAGVLVLGGLPGTVGFFGQLDLGIALLAREGDPAASVSTSLELLHPRTWALLAPLLLGLGTLGLLRTLWHAARGRPRPALHERLSEIDRREQIVGAIVIALAIGLSLLVGPLAQRSRAAQQRAVDDFHRARCLAIEAREQPRPRMRAELVSLCLDPAARIRQVYGLPGAELGGHEGHEHEEHEP
ncbi:proton-conducting transporter membrane subunit [Nannocystaceae bacterium ST9]